MGLSKGGPSAGALVRRLGAAAAQGEYKMMPLPRFSPTVHEAEIVRWHKEEGDVVESYDLIFDAKVETLSPDIPGAQTMEVEAHEDGFLAKIMVPAGAEPTPVNRPVCVVCELEEDVAFFQSEAGAELLRKGPQDLESVEKPFLWQAYKKQ